MMGLGYFKGEPGNYILRYRNGRLVDQGPGLTFFYLPFNTTIAAIPAVSQDAPFIFRETTADFQEIAIQGQLSYRLVKPLELSEMLDFSIEPGNGASRGRDPEKLVQRIVNAVQLNTRSGVSAMPMEEALRSVKDLAESVLAAVRNAPGLAEMGVAVESLHFSSVQASPEMQKAMEADFRESLQQRADQAIYARRKAAVDEEGKISRRELESEVELEERRRDLVDTQARNQLALAEADAKAEELRLAPYGELSPQVLVGLAMRDWAGKGARIGSLNLSPDLISQLVGWMGRKEA
jgi:hypothetical protein